MSGEAAPTVPPAQSAVPAAPVAPAAPTPIPSNAPPAPAKESPKEPRHPGVPKLMKSLFEQVLEEPEENTPPAEKKEPAPKTPEPPAEEKGKAKPSPDDAPIKAGKKKLPQRPELPVAKPAPAAPAAPVAAPAPAAPQNDDWESDLLDTEKEMLADARELEKRFPQKHAGLADRTAKFLREHAQMADSETFDAQDPEYVAWLAANKPKLTRHDLEELQEARIVERTEKKFSTKLEEIEHENFTRAEQPRIAAETDRFYVDAAKNSLPDEIVQEIAKHGNNAEAYEKTKEVYGMELEIAERVLDTAAQDIAEFKRLTTTNPKTGRPLVAFDEKNETHQRLTKLVASVCEDFKNGGGKELLKNGKWFVTRDEWNSMPAEARGQFWTFTNEQIIDRSKGYIKNAISKGIEERQSILKKWNFQRAPRAAAPAAPAAPVPPPAPRADVPPPAPRPSPINPAGGPPASTVDPRASTLANLFSRT